MASKDLLAYRVDECSTAQYVGDVVAAFSLSEAKRKLLDRWGLKRLPQHTVIVEWRQYGEQTQSGGAVAAGEAGTPGSD